MNKKILFFYNMFDELRAAFYVYYSNREWLCVDFMHYSSILKQYSVDEKDIDDIVIVYKVRNNNSQIIVEDLLRSFLFEYCYKKSKEKKQIRFKIEHKIDNFYDFYHKYTLYVIEEFFKYLQDKLDDAIKSLDRDDDNYVLLKFEYYLLEYLKTSETLYDIVKKKVDFERLESDVIYHIRTHYDENFLLDEQVCCDDDEYCENCETRTVDSYEEKFKNKLITSTSFYKKYCQISDVKN